MAADKALVQGAFRYGMSMVPKDTTKISMMEGASITKSLVGGITMQAKKAQAKKVIDKDLKTMMANLNKVTGIGDKQFEQAGREYFAGLDWANMDPMQKEREIANTKRMAEEGKDFATTVTDFAKNPDAYKRVEGTEGTEVDSTDGQLALLDKEDGYRLSYGENNELMVQFKGDKEAQPWAAWKAKHLKPNTDEADAKFMDGLRGDATASGKLGNDFDYGGSKQKIIKNLFKDDIDINSFANKQNFKLPDGEMGTFKDVLMLNPQVQQEVIKNMNENELYTNLLARYDVDGIKGFSKTDLQMLLSNEKNNMYQNSMGSMVDALTNPKNPLYDTELAQDILGDALAKEVQSSSYNEGRNVYTNKKDVRLNIAVDNTFDKNAKINDGSAFDLKALSRINPKERFEIVEKEGKMVYQHMSESTQGGEQTYIPKDSIPVDYTQFADQYGENYSLEDHMDNLRNFFKLRVGSSNPNIS